MIKQIVGYVRVSTKKQSVEAQKAEIVRYCEIRNIRLTGFIEKVISGRKSQNELFGEILSTLKDGDELIFNDVTRMGRKSLDILLLEDRIRKMGVTIHLVKEGLRLEADANYNDRFMFRQRAIIAELEWDMTSQRTKDALRVNGKKSGRKAGSKLDEFRDEILELLREGKKKSEIAKIIDCDPSTLFRWIKKNDI